MLPFWSSPWNAIQYPSGEREACSAGSCRSNRTRRRGCAVTLAHEIAHQWFGDSVTESDWDHTWLSEGFATYLTHLYDESTAGRDAMSQGMRRDRDNVARYYERNRASAVVAPASPSLDNILSTNSYQKGGWVLHMHWVWILKKKPL